MQRSLRLIGLLLILELGCSCRSVEPRADYKTAYSLPSDWAARCGIEADSSAAKFSFMAVTTDWIKEQVARSLEPAEANLPTPIFPRFYRPAGLAGASEPTKPINTLSLKRSLL